MNQKKSSCNLSTEVNWHFHDVVKIFLIIINNESILPNKNFYSKTSLQNLATIYQNKT